MRNKVIKVACSRCTRIDYVEETPDEKLTTPVCFQGTLKGGGIDGLEVSFDELCAQCTKTVKSLLESISKKLENVSPKRAKGVRKGRVIEVDVESPPTGVTTPPNAPALHGSRISGALVNPTRRMG